VTTGAATADAGLVMSDAIRELDQRTNHGITVTLLGNAETNGVYVSVVEERYGDPVEDQRLFSPKTTIPTT
jgi:hypothetical protein